MKVYLFFPWHNRVDKPSRSFLFSYPLAIVLACYSGVRLHRAFFLIHHCTIYLSCDTTEGVLLGCRAGQTRWRLEGQYSKLLPASCALRVRFPAV